jgi:dolichyl-diphosphooligosaccharide---protein glycosyltransferase
MLIEFPFVFFKRRQVQSVSKESREWVPKNRVCDAPGSWFCKGMYPPALEKILKEKKDFKQLEDFNAKDGDDSEYQKKYFENLNRGDVPMGRPEEKKKAAAKTLQKLPSAQIEALNKEWQNNEATSQMYTLIAQDKVVELREILSQAPQLAHIRSEDGRGPMFWAHEHRRKPIIDMLKFMGVSETREDADGMTPLDIVGSK